MTAPRALVVDDLAFNRRLLSSLLEREGIQTDEAADVAAARGALAGGKYDLVLLDIELGDGGSGWSVLDDIARREHGPSVIMVTEHARDSMSVTRALRAGAHDYVTRPVSGEVLRARISAALRARKVEDRAEITELRDAQSAALPKLPATFGDLHVAGDIVPVRGASGDLFDIVVDFRGRPSVFVVDAAGHGAAAALVAWVARDVLHGALAAGHALTKAADAMDRALARHRDLFRASVAFAVARWDEDRIEILNVGLPPVGVLDPNWLELVESKCGPLGALAWGNVAPQIIRGSRNATVAMMTDGMTAGRLDGTDLEDLLARIGGFKHGPAMARATRKQIAAIVQEHRRSSGCAVEDDATLLFASRGEP